MTEFPLTQSRPCEAHPEDAGKKTDSAESNTEVQLSRAEAKQAWLTAKSDTQRAARLALRNRLAKVTQMSVTFLKRCFIIYISFLFVYRLSNCFLYPIFSGKGAMCIGL